MVLREGSIKSKNPGEAKVNWQHRLNASYGENDTIKIIILVGNMLNIAS